MVVCQGAGHGTFSDNHVGVAGAVAYIRVSALRMLSPLLEVGVVRLNRGADGRQSREAKARGRSYEWGASIVFCDSQVRAGAPALLYISPRRLFSKVCTFVGTPA